VVSIIILYCNIIILWDHRRICGPSLIETSLCGAYLCSTRRYWWFLYQLNKQLIIRYVKPSSFEDVTPLHLVIASRRFETHLVVSSSRVKNTLDNYPVPWRHIPDLQKRQLKLYVSLKIRKCWVGLCFLRGIWCMELRVLSLRQQTSRICFRNWSVLIIHW
jgi:hypothetical protein